MEHKKMTEKDKKRIAQGLENMMKYAFSKRFDYKKLKLVPTRNGRYKFIIDTPPLKQIVGKVPYENLKLKECPPKQFEWEMNDKLPEIISGEVSYDRLKLIDYGNNRLVWDMDQPEPREFTKKDWKKFMFPMQWILSLDPLTRNKAKGYQGGSSLVLIVL